MRVERWDQELSVDESNEVLSLLARWHVSQISDASEASRIDGFIASKDWYSLCHYEAPLSLGIQDYRHVRQILAFFSKRADLMLDGVNPKTAAAETFVEAELLCRETNEIFRLRSEGGFQFLPSVESVLHGAQRKISAILGDLPSLPELKLRFGPGATTQVKKRDASARRKLAQAFCCSEDAVPILADILAEMPDWSQVPREGSETSQVCDVRLDNARIDFVRKTAKTDRTIAVEPMLNGMVQLAVGDHISNCLGRSGINLRDQSLNQRLAKEGSITGALATLDLSSASDTIAYGLVLDLLPFDWVEFLASVRCSYAEISGKKFRLEKFSTMGNGFTFALESLIFFAVAKAAAEYIGDLGPVSVYGDDIIVPVSVYGLLVDCLTAIGCKVNLKKSFSKGPFRESCGKDYYSGISVRPCYIKDVLSGETLFVLHNYYVREGAGEPASIALTMISDDLRIYGPDGYGDGHLLGAYRPIRHKANEGWAGYTFETFTKKANRSFYRLGADYVFPSYSIYISGNTMCREPIDSEIIRKKLPAVLVRGRPTPSFGEFRPDRVQSSYKGGHLSDSLPGFQGYKRIKIYTLGGA
jgi:hypothetical protein